MSLLNTTRCSARQLAARNLVPSSSAVVQQTRGAAQKAAPAKKTAQSIGGIKKQAKDKLDRLFAKEKIHKSRDLPMYGRMPEDKLKTPKTESSPATLNALFTPGTLPPPELPAFSPQEVNKDNVGKVLKFELQNDNPAKVFGVPKSMFLEFRVMPQPSSVIRDITVDTASTLKQAAASPSADTRIVFTGRAGNGKSYLLQQAVQLAKAENWIVFYVPRAVSLVNSTTPYVYDLRTQTYLQPMAAAKVVEKLLAVNRAAFEKINLTEGIVLADLKGGESTGTVIAEAGQTLAEVAEKCGRDKSHGSAPVVLEGIMKALEAQEQFPVLLAIDDFQSLFHKSLYKDPFYNPIKSFHLGVPRLLMEYASGRRGFKKGAILTALTASDTQFPIPVEMRDVFSLGYAHPTSPYVRRSSELLGYLSNPANKPLKPVAVPDRLELGEASGVFELWKAGGGIGARTYDELFLSKYTESDGNARDFVKKGVLATLAP